MIGFAMLWYLVGVLADAGAGGMVTGTAAATGALLAVVLTAVNLLLRVVTPADLRVTGRMMRERCRRTGVPRHRDPDAAGRSRPRAPTATPAVA
ncbi:DUF6412 domain-containing protein [Micromonospora sp. DT229]|uniref:DUF6412 domain-containing protein n=1 Tax=Micromonospora sp. DT229 TaxID=3393430 RepID=UPI003CF78213